MTADIYYFNSFSLYVNSYIEALDKSIKDKALVSYEIRAIHPKINKIDVSIKPVGIADFIAVDFIVKDSEFPDGL